MIKSDEAYRKAKKDLDKAKKDLDNFQNMLMNDGFTPEQINKVIGIPYMNIKKLEDDINEYERYLNGTFEYDDFGDDLGRFLIACRIWSRVSQKELADKLGVSPQQISRDERNEYRGATFEKLKSVAKILNVQVKFYTDRTYA
ncbi:helix-turn-helix domain-containing protein [Bacillus sp. Marseille-P3661]|uniref:helix-turn-helix domain-containing protein n=1 Tax=Bacillus sp. Marseille-P3661 TaxID=1936234 RepID=UPI000C823918|nr:helix-turn-helix transcriptional regulator [Bacillus sp. Marseille-P3661]